MSKAESVKAKRKTKNNFSEDPDEFLAAEYNYIAQSAFQANEDRARVTNFYLVTIGGFIAAVLGGNFSETDSNSEIVNIGFMIFFALLTFQGWLTMLQLAKLRLAWFSCIRAMNKVKSYYAEKYTDLKEFQIFEWNQSNIPPQFAKQSIGYYLALQVSALIGITAAGTTGLAVFEFSVRRSAFPAAVATFFLFSILSIQRYRSILSADSPPQSSIE